MFLYISLCSKASLWGITPFGDLMLFMEYLTLFTEYLMTEWCTSGCKRQGAALPGTEGCSRSARSSGRPWKGLNLINNQTCWIHGIDFIGTPGSFVGLSGGSDGKESVCNAGDLGLILGQEDLLEKGMATHSSVLDWRIPCKEEPGGLQFMESLRVGHDWVTFSATARVICSHVCCFWCY